LIIRTKKKKKLLPDQEQIPYELVYGLRYIFRIFLFIRCWYI